MVEKTVQSGTVVQKTTYTYDSFGNLRKVVLPSGKVIDYVIDGRNNRVGKKVNGVLTVGSLYNRHH